MNWKDFTSKQTTLRDQAYCTEGTLKLQDNLIGHDTSFRGEENNFTIQFTEIGKIHVGIVRILKIRASSLPIPSTERAKAVHDKCFPLCKAKRALNSTEGEVIEQNLIKSKVTISKARKVK